MSRVSSCIPQDLYNEDVGKSIVEVCLQCHTFTFIIIMCIFQKLATIISNLLDDHKATLYLENIKVYIYINAFTIHAYIYM